MKNTRNLAFWRRGLALLLAVCLAAGYVPVSGYAEGCSHEHGEECYEVTTECVHTHDESCYSDPALAEAGEEPDACGHECTEETGCVVRALNCGHVHDEACGEGARVQEEEPKEEPQEEPEPQPEKPEGEEAEEEPKGEPQPEEVGEVAAFEGCAHEHVNMETGVCEDCQGQAYEAKIGKKGYTTLVKAVAAAAQSNDGPTVTMLCDADLAEPDYALPSGKYVVDLNGHMTLAFYTENVDADITIKSSAPGGTVDAANFVSGTYTIGSGARWNEINVGVATLRIQGGKFGRLCYQYADTIFMESDISISGGEFDVIGPRGSGRPVSAFLAPGYAFYDMTSKKVVNAAEKTGLNNVYVDVHTHDFTTGTCACGLLCDHKTADLTTGKCGCGKVQIYQAKIGTTGYATLDAALTEAQKTENCTVTLLCDVSGEYIITGGTFTLDLNGRTISSSMKTIRLRGGALTLTDSGTGGGVTGNVAVDISAGELHIQGGTYSGGVYGLYIKPDPACFVSISGGAFEKIGLADSMDGNLVDCLAPNRAFYADPDGKTLVNAAVKELSGTVYVREHTRHTFDADGACPCGYQCPHTEAAADMTTGKCACGKVQVYEAKIGDTGYGSLGGAMDAAEEKPGCTVTLLCDVSNEESAKVDTLCVRNGGYTLDLNGNKIERTTGDRPTIAVESNLVIVDTAGGGQITSTCGCSAIYVLGGSLTIQGGTISGDVTAEKAAMLTISGGAFMGKLRHIRHFLADDLAEGYAFYADPDGDTIVSGAAEELTGPLYVRNGHSHHYVNGQCDCGQCSHTSVNMSTGKCAQCGYQVYLAKVGENKGYATLREALAAAAQTPNSTVTLLADVNVLEEDTNYCYVLDQGTFTLNLNGRKVINEKSDEHFGREIFCIQGANLTIEGDAPGSEIRRDSNWFAIVLNSGSLTIRGGKITGIDRSICTNGGELTISGGTLDGRLSIEETTAAISGGSFSEIGTDHDSLLDVLAPGYAFFDTDSGKIVDASGQKLENVSVREHTHDFEGKLKCGCGYQCGHTTIDMTTGKCSACSRQIYEAKIGTKGYATLQEALNEAEKTQGCTVKLLAKTILWNGGISDCFTVRSGAFTLDLNGCVIDNHRGTNRSLELLGGNLTIVDSGTGGTIESGLPDSIYVCGGTLKIEGGKIKGIHVLNSDAELVLSGGCMRSMIFQDGRLIADTLAEGYAIYSDEQGSKMVDAAESQLSGSYLYVLKKHPTHTKQANSTKCACGYTFPYSAVTQAPEPLTLTYTGQAQALVTPGTAADGTLVYSLTENGTYSETIPTGTLPKAYTVYYKVQGDDSHLDTEPQKVSVTVAPTDRYLDLTDNGLTGSITINGKDYSIEETGGTRFVTLPEEGDLFTTYTYGGSTHPYPTGMHVYAIERKATGSTAAEIPDFRNLLTYAGCSIRISGKQGIRMITSLDEATKKALTGKGLNGYTLEEYGTVVSWTENLAGENFLRLGESYARSNYAYRKGKADPVFARKNGVLQYTNVLLLGNLTEADYDKDLTLRAYITLRNSATGETVTLYGGTVTRSIYYVAAQNADTYKPGTTGYKFVHQIIDAVEGRS